jgi:DNA-binding NarL/FixJ family response regulator
VSPLRVVIADDHPCYRQGLAKLLTASGIEVAAEAGLVTAIVVPKGMRRLSCSAHFSFTPPE